MGRRGVSVSACHYHALSFMHSYYDSYVILDYLPTKKFLKMPATLLFAHTCFSGFSLDIALAPTSLPFPLPPRSFLFGFGGSVHVHYFGPSVGGGGGQAF
eukprot:scaffold82047_cov31-Tisochrysis_lutea.AAC.7